MRGCMVPAPRRASGDRSGAPERAGGGIGLAWSATVRATCMALALALVATRAGASATVVVRAGDPSPLGLPFSQLSDAALDDRGRIAFVGGSTVLFQRTPAGIAHLVGAGDVVQGHRLAGVSPGALGSDCLAYRATFVGGGVGIVRQCGTTTSLVAEVGFPAPGGGRFAGFAGDLAVGAGGRIAFIGVLEDGTSAVVLVEADGTLREVTRTGATSPAGGTLSGLRLVGVAASGRVGFRAVTSGGPDGLFYWSGTDVRKLAVVGDGSPAGGSFTSLGLAAMNDAETWTFRAGVSSAAGSGVFRVSTAGTLPSPISALAVDGAPTPIGGTFKDFPSSLVPAINTAGAVAFRATVQDASFSSGAFVALADGTLQKAMAVGEATAVGELVRLRDVALADDGGVVFRASLTGGAPGLFRARAGQIESLAVLGDATDLGAGFRFSDARVGASSDAALFLGTREGVFVATGTAALRKVAVLGEPTPLKGEWAGFDQPASGGGRTVFGATIQGGRTGEALFAVGRRRPTLVVKSGDRVGSFRVLDLFSSPLDNLAQASVAAGGVAFQAGLGGGTASGIVLALGSRLRAVAYQGQKAAGGGSYREFGTPAVGPAARVAFVATDGEGSAVYDGAPGGGKAVLVAAAGRESGTRLHAIFHDFATPAAGSAGVAFRGILDQSREGVFLARGRCTMALAGTGESDPSGAKFRTFGAPAVAGRTVVFRGALAGGTAPGALYRARPPRGCTQVPPPLDTLAALGSMSAVGSPLLAFGTPAGNRHGAAAVAVDVTGAGASDAIIYYSD